MRKLFSPESGYVRPIATTAAIAALMLSGCTAESKPQPPLPTCTGKQLGKEIPIQSDELMTTIRTPLDGDVDRNTHIKWEGATLAISRDWRPGVPSDSVDVHSPVENGGGSFSITDHDKDGVLEVITVSGGPGSRELSPKLSTEIKQKLVQSLAEVCKIPSPTKG